MSRMVPVNPWEGRHWAALGSSVTQFPAYTQPLRHMLGVSLTNLAVGDGGITNSVGAGAHAQITHIPDHTDLVTFEVGIVDFRMSATLGRLYDTTLDTFHGALFRCIVDTLAAGPRRTLVFLTPLAISSPVYAARWDHPNGNLDRLEDFTAAIRAVCAWCGVAVIEAGQEAGIGGPNLMTYSSDGIHLNPAGGLRLARYLFDRLSLVRPFPTVPGSVQAGNGTWTLRTQEPGRLAGTGLIVTRSDVADSSVPIAFTATGSHFFSVLWLTSDGDDALDFQSVPSHAASLWIIVACGPAGYVGIGDFGDFGLQRIAVFEAADGAVTFGPYLDVPHSVDVNAHGRRWRVRRSGDTIHVFQHRAADGMWVVVAQPINLAGHGIKAPYYSDVRMGVLASHGTAMAVLSGHYTEEPSPSGESTGGETRPVFGR